VIKVGRYSERDAQPQVPPNTPSAAPVGFKSKVVSRRHCEFWFENGKWYIKDVKSSSGTFLNHIRLSPPGTESKPYIVNDGDIIQLGIDFKGGEEMIFRCVKMRLELNRGWQSKLNNFKYVRPPSLSAPLQQRDAPRSWHLPSNMAIAPFNFFF
jgi:pSer/pThr/pTyr-binding forkhead associated (FHA) protein